MEDKVAYRLTIGNNCDDLNMLYYMCIIVYLCCYDYEYTASFSLGDGFLLRHSVIGQKRLMTSFVVSKQLMNKAKDGLDWLISQNERIEGRKQ